MSEGKTKTKAKALAKQAVKERFDPDGPFMKLILAFITKLLEGWIS